MGHTRLMVGIDMGGATTGVWAGWQDRDGSLKADETIGFVIGMPRDNDGYTYSKVERYRTRHNERSIKRRKMAKRLTILIAEALLARAGLNEKPLEEAEAKALCGLMDRRGHDYVKGRTDMSALEILSDDGLFLRALPKAIAKAFTGSDSVFKEWQVLRRNILLMREWRLTKVLPSPDEFGDSLPSDCDRVALMDAFRAFSKDAEAMMDWSMMGLRNRWMFFDDLRADLQVAACDHSHRLAGLVRVIKAAGGPERLANLLGNLANLPLRALRNYFNDRAMAGGREYWDAERCRRAIYASACRMRPGCGLEGEEAKAEKKSWNTWLKILKNTSDLLETLLTTNPDRTVYPYEDQGNRNVLTDMTLLLSPQKLTAFCEKEKLRSDWRTWATLLAEAEPALTDGLTEIAACCDRASRKGCMPGSNKAQSPKAPLEDYVKTYFLQRVFDRLPDVDPYSLRALVAGEEMCSVNKICPAATRKSPASGQFLI